MFRQFALCLAFAIAGAAATGTVQLTAPAIVEEHTPFTINHPPGVEVKAIYGEVDEETGEYRWAYLPDKHFKRDEGGTQTTAAAPPGRYLLTQGESVLIEVVPKGGDDKPKPKPKPKPGPDGDKEDPPEPQPEPSPDQLIVEWIVWIHEIEDSNDHQDEIDTWTSPDVRRLIDERGYRFKVYDDDDPKVQSFLEVTEGVRPAMVLLEEGDEKDQTRKFLVFPAPKSAEEFKSILQKHTLR